MEKIKAFLVVRSKNVRVANVSQCGAHRPCPVRPDKLHRAEKVLEVKESVPEDKDILERWNDEPLYDRENPLKCECGYVFEEGDQHHRAQSSYFRREDTGEERRWSEWGEGAIVEADWLEGMYDPTVDGKVYIAICPGGQHWTIDSRASNCNSPCANCRKPYHEHKGRPGDCIDYVDARPHKCWIRHGVAPNFTVGKDGVTCGAGAGSIQTSNWHGFLRNGYFETC